MESGTYSAERPQLAKLDEPTQARIRSTQILTTLPQIVSELVQNSLDAKANNISVSVNCAEWMCWVRDDGSGFSKQDLETFSEEDASQRYCTSKKYTPDSTNAVSTYGFRGEGGFRHVTINVLNIDISPYQPWLLRHKFRA
ncbi:hypothetical protein AGABI2DRAFT_78389 [Agaricus bisporus var. bisporus H97]|uniref:hypothetical protein n=1 Tax=Agaricus bisporus var. bisporus (strain H97 / ATCC MYA-4626 / FGSC 10389) TaxID=936046 RepID=UPI00029F6169|nr:hypothetical protein AGABI2DRAFT_78389 [Agaricus bisporus var. bisporus H97]EKV42469.1 hypothetical protein AGABI2DRAFT_78389 [Agaricus bisporus var. bisporus H97]